MSKTICISVRLRDSDVDKIKAIGRRLDVSDSDIVRFGIRLALGRLIPLLDDQACGFRILPAFVENDGELARYFDLDALRLDRIINSTCNNADCRVENHDLRLLAMHGMPSDYLRLRLQELTGEQVDGGASWATLRDYLYKKYCRPGETVDWDTDAKPMDKQVRLSSI